jgi:hypothetical protein
MAGRRQAVSPELIEGDEEHVDGHRSILPWATEPGGIFDGIWRDGRPDRSLPCQALM